MFTDNKFQFLLEKIHRNKGVDFSLYREGTLRRRIDSRLRTTGCADYLEYISYLNRNPDEYDRLLEAVTINVTEFFRNPETFHAIQHKVLPEIIKNKQEHSKKTIRAWCAGTSYGEETYSIAILFLQVLPFFARKMAFLASQGSAKASQERIADYNIKVLGTDIDPNCIAKAKIGLYEPSHLKEVNKNILNKYFHREGQNFMVNDEVKQLTEFKLHNLMPMNFNIVGSPLVGDRSEDGRAQARPLHSTSDKQLKNIDLILCRNVVIYFTKPLQELVYGLFLKSLNQGGFLVLGKVESLGGYAQGFFEAVDNKERIYRKG